MEIARGAIYFNPLSAHLRIDLLSVAVEAAENLVLRIEAELKAIREDKHQVNETPPRSPDTQPAGLRSLGRK